MTIEFVLGIAIEFILDSRYREQEEIMEQYNITGMSCAACQARVEKAVNNVCGVESCAVSLLTNSMGVEGTADPDDVIRAVEAAGYGASLKGGSSQSNSADNIENIEFTQMKRRLIASLVLLFPLMYVSMGHMMWGWPIPETINSNHIAMGLYELLLSGLIMVINQKFFISGFRGMIHKSPNMDTLVALGSAASFGYSVYALFAMTIKSADGNMQASAVYMDELYFESAAMILTLITVGKMLEARSKGKTTDALKSLMKLAPETATVIIEGQEKEVFIDEVKVGDTFAVKPGAKIPVDGIITEGYSAVNEAAFTGESVPVDKMVGDSVSAATINTYGYLVCRATSVGEDTMLSKVIRMVSDAAATKAPIAKIADKVSAVFVPCVLTISVITFVLWLIGDKSAGFAIARAISVLVISCPCALGLATPVAIMVGNGLGAKNGILYKNAQSLELAGKVQTVVFDKTGTITEGQMRVTDVIPVNNSSEESLIKHAAALESKSEHPISRAIIAYANSKSIQPYEATEFSIVAGNGLYGTVNGTGIYGGNAEYINRSTGADTGILTDKAKELAGQGKTPIYFATEKELIGIIAVSDIIKEDAVSAIRELEKMGISTVMLTGDNELTAGAIADLVGIEHVEANVKPAGKEDAIRKLMKNGRVAMVGDGINDAPALTRADVGIAIGAGTDIAIDAADIVLLKDRLRDVPAAIRISRATIKNIHQNLFWAFFYNVAGIPLAAGCFIYALGWKLNPMFGAAAMSLSSFFVVTNALRLNLVKVYDAYGNTDTNSESSNIEHLNNNSENINNTNDMEERKMKIEVKGMMCPHCEAHVKEALEGLDGVETATADHNTNMVDITTTKDVAEEAIKEAVLKAGYEYCGMC